MSDSAFDVLSMPPVTLDSLIASGATQGFSDFEPHILSRIITDGETDIRGHVLIVDQNPSNICTTFDLPTRRFGGIPCGCVTPP